MKICEKAVLLGKRGRTCSEAVVLAHADEFGMSPELAISISGGFAGGMAVGRTCGALAGAIMVLGMANGPGECGGGFVRERGKLMVQEAAYRFVKIHGSTECVEIIQSRGMNPSDPDVWKKLRETGLCEELIRDAVVIADAVRQDILCPSTSTT